MSLADIFVLAALGKLPPLEGADDALSFETGGGLPSRGNALHGSIKDSAGVFEAQNSLVEKGFQKSRGDRATD